DVFYFFVYAASLGIIVSMMERGGTGLGRYLDFSAFGYLMEQTQKTFHTQAMSIGASDFNPAKAPITIAGLNLAGDAWATRLVSTITPIPMLLLARVFFHRFDPACIRAAGAKGRRGWMRSFNALAKPFARVFAAIPVRRAALTDAMITFAITPFAGIALIGITIAALASAKSLPVTFAIAAIFIADIASRDRRAGTTPLISASPRLRENIVLWKFASSSIVAAMLLIVPIVRNPIAVITGILLIAAAATSLGVISGNPKTFIVLFLTLWYVVVNDHGKTKSLDFAGFYGTPSIGVTAMYVAIAIAFVVAAAVVHRTRDLA
ncbi:MAG: hypothetical protein JO088_04015, partial [Acidobacteria bacterium]|nr:hypothetical protein [Acidobacteriota bacterium]